VDTETARVVLTGITGLAVIVWLLSFRFLVSSARKGQPVQSGESVDSENAGSSEETLLTGATEVEGEPSALVARAASLLARGSLLPQVPIKIVEKSASHVRFERVEAGNEVQSAGRWLRQGQFTFVSLGGGRSRVEWVVELINMRWLLRLGALFQVAGLIAIAVGFWAIFTYVISSPDPAIRWQTVQMVQVVHFLWPPFLFAALYRRGKRTLSAQLHAWTNNLPYLGEKA
jgi:hypothetical protein